MATLASRFRPDRIVVAGMIGIGAALQTILQTANVGSMALAGVAAAAIGSRGVFLAAGGLAVTGGLVGLLLFRGAHAHRPATEAAT